MTLTHDHATNLWNIRILKDQLLLLKNNQICKKRNSIQVNDVETCYRFDFLQDNVNASYCKCQTITENRASQITQQTQLLIIIERTIPLKVTEPKRMDTYVAVSTPEQIFALPLVATLEKWRLISPLWAILFSITSVMPRNTIVIWTFEHPIAFKVFAFLKVFSCSTWPQMPFYTQGVGANLWHIEALGMSFSARNLITKCTRMKNSSSQNVLIFSCRLTVSHQIILTFCMDQHSICAVVHLTFCVCFGDSGRQKAFFSVGNTPSIDCVFKKWWAFLLFWRHGHKLAHLCDVWQRSALTVFFICCLWPWAVWFFITNVLGWN